MLYKNINLQKYLEKQIIYINLVLKNFLPKGKSILAQCMSYSVLVGADYHSIKALEIYGLYTGILSFQTIDDVLDMYSKKQVLGKIGSDMYNKKLTVSSLYNKQEIDNNINKCMIKAKKAISYFGKKADIFIQIVEYIKNRQY